MASAPSASALSAVVRCRGNLWTRNPPTKRPASASYSLGLAGGALRDSSAARAGSNQTSAAWKVFPAGEPRGAGRRAAVECRWDRVGDEALREADDGEINQLFTPKLSQSSGSARSAAPRVKNTPARGPTAVLLGRDTCSKIIHIIKCESRAARVRDVIAAVGGLPPGVLKVCVTSTCVAGVSGEKPSFVSPAWSTVRSACVSLSSLVSRLILLKLLHGSRAQDAPPRLLRHQDPTDAHQTNAQVHMSSQDNVSSRWEMTEDRPD